MGFINAVLCFGSPWCGTTAWCLMQPLLQSLGAGLGRAALRLSLDSGGCRRSAGCRGSAGSVGAGVTLVEKERRCGCCGLGAGLTPRRGALGARGCCSEARAARPGHTEGRERARRASSPWNTVKEESCRPTACGATALTDKL